MSLDKELSEYTAKTARSRALHEEALGVMPGGNSRTTTFFDPYPFYFQRGQGAHIWDADGTERIDFNNNYTSRYARLLAREPELKGLIELRAIKENANDSDVRAIVGAREPEWDPMLIEGLDF